MPQLCGKFGPKAAGEGGGGIPSPSNWNVRLSVHHSKQGVFMLNKEERTKRKRGYASYHVKIARLFQLWQRELKQVETDRRLTRF